MLQGFLKIATNSPFDYTAARQYVGEVQFNCFLITLGYVVVIFTIKAIMSQRKAFEIKLALQLWNLWLAVFSIAGALVTTVALWQECQKHGLVSSYTKAKDFFEGTSGLWTFLFFMSKIGELGDTIFIVLRKKPLMFLHWYHHVATLNYGLMSYIDKSAFNTWIVWLNFSVHAIMYSYYFAAACSIRAPAYFSRLLTSCQITQFLITLAILAHVGLKLVLGQHVDTSVPSYVFCLLMEISYVVLFGNFFYHAYIKGGGKKFHKEKGSGGKSASNGSAVHNGKAE